MELLEKVSSFDLLSFKALVAFSSTSCIGLAELLVERLKSLGKSFGKALLKALGGKLCRGRRPFLPDGAAGSAGGAADSAGLARTVDWEV